MVNYKEVCLKLYRLSVFMNHKYNEGIILLPTLRNELNIHRSIYVEIISSIVKLVRNFSKIYSISVFCN